MQFDWRTTSGPALTVATALIAIGLDRDFMAVPDPAPLFVCIVAFAGSLSGLPSGLATAAFAVTALSFVHHRGAADYGSADLARQAMLSVTVTGTAIITGLLRKRLMDAFSWERRQHAAAERLSAALDQVEIGIVLLDADTRAEFINRAFRHYFALPDEKADSKPPFIALMHHGRDIRAWEMPEDELNEFIAQRIRLMRAGDQTPVNITLRDGQVLRFSCTALPDGGRMLSYTPVTDLVRHTDDPAQIDYYQSLRGGGIRGGTSHLRAAE
jgi:PAS domain-containing protein